MEILEADGLEFAQRFEAGEDLKVGDGQKILEVREEKAKKEAAAAALEQKDEERGVPEIPQPVDTSNVDISGLLNFGKDEPEEGSDQSAEEADEPENV